jgi:hypothetical protein
LIDAITLINRCLDFAKILFSSFFKIYASVRGCVRDPTWLAAIVLLVCFIWLLLGTLVGVLCCAYICEAPMLDHIPLPGRDLFFSE